MNSHPNTRPTKSVVVIGGGISGLCVAYWLKQRGVDVTVMERDPQVGGTMRTLHENGFLIEKGPNSALETTPLFQQLFHDLGIADQVAYADEAAAKRYIVRDGELHAVPMGPKAFLSSKLWSTTGKLRLLKEPFIGRASREESIAQFVERRLGREFLDYAINPFVAGVYAGNPATLSVRAAFPKLYALEEKYGSLIIGAIRSARERKQRKEVAKDRAKLFSFRDGMETLPNSLAKHLGNAINLSTSVERVVPMRAGESPIYTVYYTHDGVRRTAEANAIVLSSPAYAAADIIRPIDPEMAGTLESIDYPPVAQIFLGFRGKQVTRPLDGFGMLVPEVEHRNILGTIWSSSLFPGRAPDGYIALTTFVGGSRQPELVSRPDGELKGLVLDDIRALMSIDGEPSFQSIIRWERAIPQYSLGYQKILDAIERFELNFRGTFVCSNYRGGIAVGDCLMSAEKITDRVLTHLKIPSSKPN